MWGVMLSPMALGIGYLIGPLATGCLVPGRHSGLPADCSGRPGRWPPGFDRGGGCLQEHPGFRLDGRDGVGIVIAFVLDLFKKGSAGRSTGQPEKTGVKTKTGLRGRTLQIGAVLIAYLFSLVAGLQPLAAVLLVGGVFIATAMAATITGETGINPMEIFGIIILLAIRTLVPVPTTAAFLIAACVAIACGYAGDVLNDYKSGYILQTNPKAQFISELVGGTGGDGRCLPGDDRFDHPLRWGWNRVWSAGRPGLCRHPNGTWLR